MPRYMVRGERQYDDKTVEFQAPVQADSPEAAEEQFLDTVEDDQFDVQEVQLAR